MKENDMYIQVDIDYDLAEKITCKTLRGDYDLLSTRMSLPLFSSDPEEEKRKVKKLKKAYEQIFKYYGTGEMFAGGQS